MNHADFRHWAHELAEAPSGQARFVELASIKDLPAWIAKIT